MTVETSPARPAPRSAAVPPGPTSAAPLLSLQVLRAAAACLVLVHHAAYDADTIAGRTGAAPLGLDRFVDLAFGVHLFFVVSGFIMLSTARGFGSVRGAATFMARRAIRVVPLYWMLTGLVLIGAAVAPQLLNTPLGGVGVVAGSFLFVPVLRDNGTINPVLGQGWTLDYEMFFYVLFASSMLLPRRAALFALAGGLVGLVLLGRVVAVPAGAVGVWTDGLLLEFLLGLAVGWVGERGWRCGPTAAALLIAAGCIAAVALGPLTGRFDGVAPWLRSGVPAAALVAGCALGPRWPAWHATVALAAVGDASYSLYLSHPFAVRLLRQMWLGGGSAVLPAGAYLPAACLVAVGCALALHRAVERPLTRWLQRRGPMAVMDHRPILPEVAERAHRG